MDDRYWRHRPGKLDDQTDKVGREAIQEARIVLFSATMLIAIAIALIMTPAAYHRLAEQTIISKFFVWLASWLIAAAMVPLMLGLTL